MSRLWGRRWKINGQGNWIRGIRYNGLSQHWNRRVIFYTENVRILQEVRGDIFVWFLFKKIIKLNFFFKKKWNQFKPISFGLVQFFRIKTGSNRFGSIFSVWLGFFQDFFRFEFGSFYFFDFMLINSKSNRSVLSKF